VSKFDNNNPNPAAPVTMTKTRNFTQVPSLKSSPLQRGGGIMPKITQKNQEEDYIDEDFVIQTEELDLKEPKLLHIQMSEERRSPPMNLELFQNH
jgi:hypothetical protein